MITGGPGCEGASPETDGEGQRGGAFLVVGALGLSVLVLSLVVGEVGDLTGVDVAALLRRFAGAGPTGDGATRVPITTADGEQ